MQKKMKNPKDSIIILTEALFETINRDEFDCLSTDCKRSVVKFILDTIYYNKKKPLPIQEETDLETDVMEEKTDG